MSLTISDDLRQALASEGTPLKLFDPKTGETYLVVREAAFHERAEPSNAEQELASVQISSDHLKQLAQHHAPPQQWYDSEEEDLFE
jgi:hypothetical protein